MAAAARPRPRGILGGAILIATGSPFLLQALGIPNTDALLFIALGLAFLAAWVMGTRQYVYLVPAAELIAFGLGILIPRVLPLPANSASPIFLGSLALGLIVVFIAHPDRRMMLVPAAVLAAVALTDLFFNVDAVPVGLKPFFVPIVLIAVGVYLLVEPRTH